ncbi:hypothetical protein HQR03_04645 [Psychrobacter okhotskensis]|uniref:hypothetical protein n=1 Tax=Psychrobacter okhotskensis TaxID=212403 RepID=UPI00156742E5|nr:hypothetical protein [Psychrobacter okhotskensis]NRD69823.1 hypothetical protein [Psychrobacter okhotskensis]
MKFIKLSAISAAILASTAALAAEPVIVVDEADAVVYEAEPVAVAYEAEPANAGMMGKTAGAVRNTTGAVVGGTKTLFNTAVNPAAVSAEIGTLGYGANVAWALNDKVELQAGWAGGDVSDFSSSVTVKDVKYKIDDADFSNPYLGVQLRPAGNWFTVGAGIIVPDNDIDVSAEGRNDIFKIGNVSYNATDTGKLSGTVEHRNKLAPYGTIGFRPNIGNNWGVFGEIGAAYMGKTDATVRAIGDADESVGYISGSETVKKADSDITRGDVAAAAQKELESKDWLEWFPIVKLGATYRF